MRQGIRLGAIDAGTNAIRLVIADASDPAAPVPIERRREPVRLGRGTYACGELERPSIDRAAAAFRRFRALFDYHGVTHYRAVATSAVRNAHNRDTLVRRLYDETGLVLEVIGGDEEARLARKAVLGAFAHGDEPECVLDLGGGSLEIEARAADGWRGVSLPVGTVRLLETFVLNGDPSAPGVIDGAAAERVRGYTRAQLDAASALPAPGGGPVVACGGNVALLARLFGDRDASGMPGLDHDRLARAVPGLLAADVPARMERFGLRRERAEVIGVAALVLDTVCHALCIPRLCAPGVGLRDAILAELRDRAWSLRLATAPSPALAPCPAEPAPWPVDAWSSSAFAPVP